MEVEGERSKGLEENGRKKGEKEYIKMYYRWMLEGRKRRKEGGMEVRKKGMKEERRNESKEGRNEGREEELRKEGVARWAVRCREGGGGGGRRLDKEKEEGGRRGGERRLDKG